MSTITIIGKKELRARIVEAAGSRELSPASMRAAIEAVPRKSIVGRPEYDDPQITHCAIIGRNAATLDIIPTVKKPEFSSNALMRVRYTGTYGQCKKTLTYAISHWFQLPLGREIEAAAEEVAI